MDFLQKELITVKDKIWHFDTMLNGLLNPQDYTSHMEKLTVYSKFWSEIEDVKNGNGIGTSMTIPLAKSIIGLTTIMPLMIEEIWGNIRTMIQNSLTKFF